MGRSFKLASSVCHLSPFLFTNANFEFVVSRVFLTREVFGAVYALAMVVSRRDRNKTNADAGLKERSRIYEKQAIFILNRSYAAMVGL